MMDEALQKNEKLQNQLHTLMVSKENWWNKQQQTLERCGSQMNLFGNEFVEDIARNDLTQVKNS